MMFRRLHVLAVLLTPGLAFAQEPEQLLSAKTQLYFRWDGQKVHRDAYLRTALGKMLQGDTGKMVDNLFGLLYDNVNSSLTVKGLLEGAPPEKVQKMQQEVAQAMKLLGLLGDHGLIVAAEVTSANPPGGQVALIVPDIGDRAESLFATLRVAASLYGLEPVQKEVAGRKVTLVDVFPVQVGFWKEGKHAVVVGGPGTVEPAVKRMTASSEARLPSVPLYKKLRGFKDFQTSARAFLDMQALTKLAGAFGKEIKQAIETVGLDSLDTVTFHSGFENETERGLVEISYRGERKGLLAMTTGKPFKLSDVPALPTDVLSWSMTSFDAAASYDAALKAAETLVGLFAPNEAAKLKEFVQQADQALGIDIRKDLLGALGDRMLQYSSPGEGVFTLSQTVAFKVKDGSKLLDTLDQAAKGLAGSFGAKMALKKRKYRGVDLREVRINEMGFFFLPSYAIVDGWLVISYFPQPVHGFILRAKHELPAWKPEESVTRSLEKMPKEFLSVSVSDPRPSVKQLLALGPLAGSAVRSFFPDTKFDPGLIPNGAEACQHLFPNVSITSDDGKATRIHTRASLALPLDVAGVDAYVLAIGGIGLFASFAGR